MWPAIWATASAVEGKTPRAITSKAATATATPSEVAREIGRTLVRAFTAGLTPLTLGLLLSTGWVLTAPVRGAWVAAVLVLGTVVASVRTRISPMWLIAVGAVVGALALR